MILRYPFKVFLVNFRKSISLFCLDTGTFIKDSPGLLPMVGAKPILAQLFVFLYTGFYKGVISFPLFDVVM